jgi:glucose-1-phosphate thymidylyltransferase
VKGLVLAGGSGTGLRPLTYSGAKQLVPVANRPIVFYVLENIVRAGVHDIGVIISPQTGAQIQQALGDGSAFGAKLTFIRQDEPRGLAHAVLTAREFLGDDPFVMYLGDNLVGTAITDFVTAFRENEGISASVLLKAVDDPRAFGVAELDADGNVVGLVEKPKEPKSQLALVGVYLFRSAIFQAILGIRPSARGELEITDAISALLASGHKCRFGMLDSWWLDTGKKDDLLRANRTILDEWLSSEQLGHVDAASRVTGSVRIEARAVIERSVIRGPAVIGRGARIIDSEIGPYSSIGDGVEIRDASVEHSVVLEGASIQGVKGLVGSVIGRRVRLRSSSLEGGPSLMVGDDCILELGSR